MIDLGQSLDVSSGGNYTRARIFACVGLFYLLIQSHLASHGALASADVLGHKLRRLESGLWRLDIIVLTTDGSIEDPILRLETNFTNFR